MSHLVSTTGPQQPGERLRRRSLRRQRKAAFNRRREPAALDTIRIDSSQETIERRSVNGGGLFRTHTASSAVKPSKRRVDHRSVAHADTLLRHHHSEAR